MDVSEQKVVLSEHLDEDAAAWLTERVRLVRQPHEESAALAEELKDATGLVVRTYTKVDAALLDRAPQLRVVGRAGVGLDNIDLEACRKRNVRVVYTPDANTQAVVEYVWALVLDALRPRLYLNGYTEPENFHRYRKEQVGYQLDELTLGVLGMGRIGRHVASVARAFNMRFICNDLLDPEALGLSGELAASFVDSATLWRDADILTVHVDGRSENRHLIGREVLQQLKPSCLLINTSRGFVIDPHALAAWAKFVEPSGGAAVLDVHEPEPPPEAYPLFGLPNVKLLPHLASRTTRALSNMSWVVRDVVRVLGGEEPHCPAV